MTSVNYHNKEHVLLETGEYNDGTHYMLSFEASTLKDKVER
jgi:hypothetical protein